MLVLPALWVGVALRDDFSRPVLFHVSYYGGALFREARQGVPSSSGYERSVINAADGFLGVIEVLVSGRGETNGRLYLREWLVNFSGAVK